MVSADAPSQATLPLNVADFDSRTPSPDSTVESLTPRSASLT
jgi:hypothetical protein